MIAIKLTPQQKDLIHGVFFTENTFFNCVQDFNNDWFVFLSADDKEKLDGYAYLLDLPLFEFVAKTETPK